MEGTYLHGNEEVNILRVLSIDLCAQVILDQVPIKDLMRSERVSRQWQVIIQNYLQHCSLTLFDVFLKRSKFFENLINDDYESAEGGSHRRIDIPRQNVSPQFIHKIIEKWGSCIVKLVTNRYDAEYLKNISLKCSDLQHVKFLQYKEYDVPINQFQKCKNLRQVSLKYCMLDCNRDLTRFFQNFNCEKIEISRSPHQVSLEFLKPIDYTGKLKSFSLKENCNISIFRIPSDIDCLRDVTSLELDRNNHPLLLAVHLIIKLTPKLEYLSISGYPTVEREEEFISSITGLVNLKHLKMTQNEYVTDTLLKALVRGCKKLERLDLRGTNFSYPSLATLCGFQSPMTITINKWPTDLVSFACYPFHDRSPGDTANELLAAVKNDYFTSNAESVGVQLNWHLPMTRRYLSHLPIWHSTKKSYANRGQIIYELSVGCSLLKVGSCQHELRLQLYN